MSRIFGGTVAASVQRDKISVEENPRTRRFGILPAVPVLDVHPRESGQQQHNIPYGFPVRFDTFPGMLTPTWDVDKDSKAPPVGECDLTAREAIESVKRAAWQSSADMGFRELSALTPLEDEDAERLINLVLPELDPATCRYGEENTEEIVIDEVAVVGGERVARSRTTALFRCLHCTLLWLESSECEFAAREAGERAALLRTQLLDAYRTNRDFFRASWNQWKAEMEERAAGKEYGLARFGDAHYHVMHQLHETSPADRAAEAIRDGQAAQAEAMKEGFREAAREMAEAVRPQTSAALDVNEIIRQAKEAAKEEIRAELAAEKEQTKNGKGTR
jgi:hypothetical protein